MCNQLSKNENRYIDTLHDKHNKPKLSYERFFIYISIVKISDIRVSIPIACPQHDKGTAFRSENRTCFNGQLGQQWAAPYLNLGSWADKINHV